MRRDHARRAATLKERAQPPGARRCPFCHAAETAAPLAPCARCAAPVHAACLEEHGGACPACGHRAAGADAELCAAPRCRHRVRAPGTFYCLGHHAGYVAREARRAKVAGVGCGLVAALGLVLAVSGRAGFDVFVALALVGGCPLAWAVRNHLQARRAAAAAEAAGQRPG